MNKVFVVHHEYEWCNHDETKFIGVYATMNDAQAAVVRLRVEPGFREWPDGFLISDCELGVTSWLEGFVTYVTILIPSRSVPGTYHLAGTNWRPGDIYEITDISNADDAVFSVGDVVRCNEIPVPGYSDQSLVAFEIVPNTG